MAQLILHTGALTATRDEVLAVKTPGPTQSWYPIPHEALINRVTDQLHSSGFEITGERYGLTKDGNRFFGVLDLANKGEDGDYRWIVGLRNSHDKSFPAGLVAGTQVFVCDNLSFSGEVRLARKHTRFVERDLRQLTARAIGQLGTRLAQMDTRVRGYKDLELKDRDVHDIVIRAADCRAITPSQIPDVLSEWRNPTHDEFRPRTAWSLFNGITEVYKQIQPSVAMKRGEALHGLFDAVAGLSFRQGAIDV